MVKNLPVNGGDANLILRLGRSPGGGNGNPLQYSCLGDPVDRDWWATVHGFARQLDMTWQLNNNNKPMEYPVGVYLSRLSPITAMFKIYVTQGASRQSSPLVSTWVSEISSLTEK